MRLGFIGCVESSKIALETVLGIEGVDVCAVVTRAQSKVNADFFDLSDICKEKKIPFHYETPRERAASVNFFKKYDLDVIYCIGWSYLLGGDLLSLTQHGVIGFHPAKLPQNRGRHPIIWALALGLDATASTFFKMDKGADSGPILSQQDIFISPNDDAKSLYEKIMTVSKAQIASFTTDLINGEAVYQEQDHSKATYWRKRSRKDGNIDFRMSADAIHNLVRSLAPPYPCAEFMLNDQHIKVLRSEPLKGGQERNVEPGKVLGKHKDRVLVKVAGSDAIWLEGMGFKDIQVGQYL